MLADEQEAETGPEENSLGKGIMSMQYRKSNIFGIRVVLALVIILAMASFALVGCGDDEVATDETEGTTVETASAGTESTDGASAEAPENVPDEPLKIGLLVARSGVTAPVGEAAHRAVEWWAERVNADGGILGRQVELLVEEESNPQDTVDRMRKLVLEDEVSAVLGLISTGVSLATAPIAEELETPLLMWDGTTQDGVEETMPDPAYTFRSTDNETEAIAAASLLPSTSRTPSASWGLPTTIPTVTTPGTPIKRFFRSTCLMRSSWMRCSQNSERQNSPPTSPRSNSRVPTCCSTAFGPEMRRSS